MLEPIFRRLLATARTKAGLRNPHPARRPSMRAEHLETMFAAASQGIGECPAWVILTLEASETLEGGHHSGRR